MHSLTDAGSGVVFDGDNDNIYFTVGNSLYKYANEGEDWIKRDLVFIIEATGLSVNPKNSNELFLTTGWGGYHSMDGGVSWTERNNGFYYGKNELLYSVAHSNKGPIVVSSDWTYYTYNTSTTDVNNDDHVPSTYSLEYNYPNPFNPSTIIEYSLSSPEKVSIIVYNILGEEVSHLVNELKSAGTHQVEFDASGLSSGVYFYRIIASDFIQTKKCCC